VTWVARPVEARRPRTTAGDGPGRRTRPDRRRSRRVGWPTICVRSGY